MSDASTSGKNQPRTGDRKFEDQLFKQLEKSVEQSISQNPHRIVFFIEDSVNQINGRLKPVVEGISTSFPNSTKFALTPFPQASDEIATITGLRKFAELLKYYIALKNKFPGLVTFELISDQDLGGFNSDSNINQGFVNMWITLLNPENEYLTPEEIEALSGSSGRINLILYSKQAPTTTSQYENLVGVNYSGAVVKSKAPETDADTIAGWFTRMDQEQSGIVPPEA